MTLLDSRLAAVLLVLAASPALAAATPAKTQAAAPANTPDGLVAAAHAAAVRGETELALRLAQSAIVADPARPASYDALGDIYAGANQADFARNYYNAALSIDPSDSAALKALAALDHGGGRRSAEAGSASGTP